MVVSPTFKKIKPEFFDIVNKIALQNKVKFLNFYEAKKFKSQKNLFHDSEHLNDEGASLFTKEVISQIKF